MPAETIIVKIQNTKPIELLDFTRALLALGDQFKRDVEADASQEVEVRLFVKELRTGSLIAELSAMDSAQIVPVAAGAYAIMEHANVVGDFVEHARALIDWLKGTGEKPAKIDAPTVKNIVNLVEPVAKDAGSNLTISITGDNNHVPIIISSLESNAVQNKGGRYLDSLKEPQTKTQRKKLMYWSQVRNESGPSAGEKAYIESISDKPVKVIFDSHSLREEMLYGRENPLKEAYIVDVEVQTVRGRVAVYKVLEMHERVNISEDAAPIESPLEITELKIDDNKTPPKPSAE